MVDGEGTCAYCWIFNKENKSKSLVSWIVRDHKLELVEFIVFLSKSLVSCIVRDSTSLLTTSKDGV